MKKKGILLAVLAISIVLMSLVQISLVSSMDIKVSAKEISSVAIIELNRPALFELSITNNKPSAETLEVYSLVGVELKPKEAFMVEGNETKTINLEVYPRKIPGYFSFEYKIKNSDGEIKTGNLAINIVNLKDAFTITADDITPDSTTATIYFQNKAGSAFDNIIADFSCSFFKDAKTFTLSANEKKKIEFAIDKEKSKELVAGPYLLTTNFEILGKKAETISIIKFTEKSGIQTTETQEGFLLRRYEITKTNYGNIPANIEIVVRKNIFSSIFTTFGITPTNYDTIGTKKFYVFQKTLMPGDSFNVVVQTNWWILVLFIFGIAITIYLIKRYSSRKLLVTKKVHFVKTKGGEFALKVTIIVKAREFVEKIKVIDKLPAMVKIYERYGTILPDKIDEKNKRIEWNIEGLSKGEERVFSFIIYSKIGVVGRFELPRTKAIYEYRGQIKEIDSNRAFFINEPKGKKGE